MFNFQVESKIDSQDGGDQDQDPRAKIGYKYNSPMQEPESVLGECQGRVNVACTSLSQEKQDDIESTTPLV